MSGWSITAVIVGGWLWGQVVAIGQAAESPTLSLGPSVSRPAVAR
ncbi:hypothetical protein [Streptomyces sp. NPDC006368]